MTKNSASRHISNTSQKKAQEQPSPYPASQEALGGWSISISDSYLMQLWQPEWTIPPASGIDQGRCQSSSYHSGSKSNGGPTISDESDCRALQDDSYSGNQCSQNHVREGGTSGTTGHRKRVYIVEPTPLWFGSSMANETNRYDCQFKKRQH